jgi:purine-binding chemotaxis protein CheW
MPVHELMLPDGGETRQFATFYVGDLFFGIEAVRVQEVIRSQEMTEIPLAPAAIQGLINLRGQIVAAVDTRCSLGLPLAEPGKQPMNIIIQTEDGAVSLLVDEIGDVLEVPIHSFAPVPDNVPAPQRDMIGGVYKLRHQLMLALDTAKMLEHACH